jgi:hypothetical protein
MLGVLVSAGAAICLAPCGSALFEWNPGQAIDAVTGRVLLHRHFIVDDKGQERMMIELRLTRK